MTYSEKLKDPRWQKKRLEILKRDKFTCQLCGDKDTTLHVHHKSYGNNPWESKNKNLITYCCHCHSIVEYYKDNELSSEPVRAFKAKTESFYFIHVITRRSYNKNAFAIFSFEYNTDINKIELTSVVFPDQLEDINKEIIKQGLKHFNPADQVLQTGK